MPYTVEEAQTVANLRLKMVENMAAGKAPEAGIDKEVLRQCLEIVRKERSIGDATGSKAKAKAPVIPLDLNEFMKSK